MSEITEDLLLLLGFNGNYSLSMETGSNILTCYKRGNSVSNCWIDSLSASISLKLRGRVFFFLHYWKFLVFSCHFSQVRIHDVQVKHGIDSHKHLMLAVDQTWSSSSDIASPTFYFFSDFLGLSNPTLREAPRPRFNRLWHLILERPSLFGLHFTSTHCILQKEKKRNKSHTDTWKAISSPTTM